MQRSSSSASHSRGKKKKKKKGWLTKKGGSRANWKRRWFVLAGNELRYFSSEDETQRPLGTVYLAGSKAQVDDTQHRRKGQHIFCVVPPDSAGSSRTFYMAAETVTEMRSWVRALEKAGREVVASFSSDPGEVLGDSFGNKFSRPLKQGYMEKQGHRMRNWKQRWVTARKNVLLYYERQEDEGRHAPLGVIPLHGCTVEMMRRDASVSTPNAVRSFTRKIGVESRREHKFNVHHKSRKSFLMAAADGNVMEDWILAITTAISPGRSGKNKARSSDSRSFASSLGEVQMQGGLMMSRDRDSPRRLHFVLKENVLYFCKDSKTSHPLNALELENAVVSESKSPGHFSIKYCQNVVFLFDAGSDSVRTLWVAGLEAGIEQAKKMNTAARKKLMEHEQSDSAIEASPAHAKLPSERGSDFVKLGRTTVSRDVLIEVDDFSTDDQETAVGFERGRSDTTPEFLEATEEDSLDTETMLALDRVVYGDESHDSTASVDRKPLAGRERFGTKPMFRGDNILGLLDEESSDDSNFSVRSTGPEPTSKGPSIGRGRGGRVLTRKVTKPPKQHHASAIESFDTMQDLSSLAGDLRAQMREQDVEEMEDLLEEPEQKAGKPVVQKKPQGKKQPVEEKQNDRKCPKCGVEKLEAMANFCDHCGVRFSSFKSRLTATSVIEQEFEDIFCGEDDAHDEDMDLDEMLKDVLDEPPAQSARASGLFHVEQRKDSAPKPVLVRQTIVMPDSNSGNSISSSGGGSSDEADPLDEVLVDDFDDFGETAAVDVAVVDVPLVKESDDPKKQLQMLFQNGFIPKEEYEIRLRQLEGGAKSPKEEKKPKPQVKPAPAARVSRSESARKSRSTLTKPSGVTRCVKCKSKMKVGKKFCTSCGAKQPTAELRTRSRTKARETAAPKENSVPEKAIPEDLEGPQLGAAQQLKELLGAGFIDVQEYNTRLEQVLAKKPAPEVKNPPAEAKKPTTTGRGRKLVRSVGRGRGVSLPSKQKEQQRELEETSSSSSDDDESSDLAPPPPPALSSSSSSSSSSSEEF